METSTNNEIDVLLTATDIHRAAAEQVIGEDDAERLIQWASAQFAANKLSSAATGINRGRVSQEEGKGLNLVSVAYYFGAMLMISACAWFLGDKWDELGSRGILITSLIYLGIAAGTGFYLRKLGFPVAGGLLVTVAVSLVPLVTYSIEDLAGVWPTGKPGAYKDYYPWIHGSWVVMELATIGAAALALTRVRFSFLTAPMAFSFWFLSMDIAAWALGTESLDMKSRSWVSVVVGLITLGVGYGLDRTLKRKSDSVGEDFAFWCYLFGLMAFWGGLTSMDSNSEVGALIYALINLGLIAIAVKLRRTTFLVFGAVGVNVYLGHLAYKVFADSFFFPFILALSGLLTILAAVWFQKKLLRSPEQVAEP